MNDKLVEALLPMIDKAKEVGASTVDLLMKESPVLVGEILSYSFFMSLASHIIDFVIMIVCLLSIKPALYLTKKMGHPIHDHETPFPLMGAIFMWTMLGIFTLCTVIGTFSINKDWLQIWLAPRLFLIEYISGLIK